MIMMELCVLTDGCGNCSMDDNERNKATSLCCQCVNQAYAIIHSFTQAMFAE